VRFGVEEDRMVLTQIREPLVRHAVGEDVPVEQVDVVELHVTLFSAPCRGRGDRSGVFDPVGSAR